MRYWQARAFLLLSQVLLAISEATNKASRWCVRRGMRLVGEEE
jgi:hypothetical protein